MCKVLIIPHVPKGKERQAFNFIKASVPLMAKDDKDGIGYAAVSPDGKLFGEVWLNPKDAFGGHRQINALDERVASILGDDVTKIGIPYRRHGIPERTQARSIMLHTRSATCEKGLANAHPFFRDDIALIHNGMISNADKLTNISSTCDSETILNEYVANKVHMSSGDKISDVTSTIEGWYAVGVMAKSENTWIVDIFKETRSNLVCAFIKELNTVVFCTTEGILRRTAKLLGMHISSIHVVKAGMLYRFNAFTGECTAKIPFKAKQSEVKTYSWISSQHAGYQHDLERDEPYAVDELIRLQEYRRGGSNE